jgi:nucleoside-diphosphate-sugar epimerase
MMRVAVTGSNGFIGSHFVDAARGRFQVKAIQRRSGDGKVSGVQASLDDVQDLSSALQDCDAVVHCAHDGVNERANAIRAANLVQAAKNAGVRRMIAFGTFATYDNTGATITETSPSCKARIPYISEKLRLESVLAGSLHTANSSLRVAFLQPTIVVGEGGSWDRFARRLQSTERILLPRAGNGVCNLVSVDSVVSAICACLEAADSSFGAERMLKLLVSDNAPVTWAQWLNQSYGIPAERVEACNDNAWAENTKRNLLLAFRYSVLGDALMNLRQLRSSDASATVETPRDEWPISHPVYIPEGLDRLTLACRAVVRGRDFHCL